MITALIRKRSGAAKPPNLSALRQIITQYGLTQASILPGPRVSPSGHRSRRCHPAPDPKGFALWTPNRRCRPVPGQKGAALLTPGNGLTTLCTPAKDADRRYLRIALNCIFARAVLPDSVPAPVISAAFCSPWYAPCDTSPENISISDGHSFFKLQCCVTGTS